MLLHNLRMESSSGNPSYLREVEIKFKKRKVKNGAAEAAVTDAKQVYELFADLQNETKEKLLAISLDTKLKVIAFEVVALGSLVSIAGRPAEVVRASIMVNAYGIIIVHNHPSGDPTPSKVDKEFTKTLNRVCNDLGISFHDHVIIGEGDYFSFAEAGLLE